MARIPKPCGRTRRFVRERVRWARPSAERLRFQCLVALWKGKPLVEIADALDVSLATVHRVRRRYVQGGVHALLDGRSRRPMRKVTPHYIASLVGLVEHPPDFDREGRSNWTAALLARALQEKTGIGLHFTWVWQLLRRSGYRWKRTRPIVRACNPRRRWQWARLVRVLWQILSNEVLLFADEVDIDFNPKTGYLWCRRGVPAEIGTPGRNKKRYLAGALNVDTGNFLYVEDERKRSSLFVKLLHKISSSYRYAKKIHILLDNYSIHHSRLTRSALADLGHRIRLHFLPEYSPEYNPVERVWHALHDAVTRNHRFGSLEMLMRAVRRYLCDLGSLHLESPLPFRVTRRGLVVSDAK